MKGIFSKLTDDAEQQDSESSEEDQKADKKQEAAPSVKETKPISGIPANTPDIKAVDESSATTESIGYNDEEASDEDTRKYFA